MLERLLPLIHQVDRAFSMAYVRLFGEDDTLLAFIFHGMVREKKEIDTRMVEPERIITHDEFRQFVEYFLAHEYTFVSPDQVQNGLEPGRKYGLVTFDDGYFNNSYVLPLLEEYRVPALFFISTDHVLQNKCFWWDVLFRESFRRGISVEAISREQEALKAKKNEEIEAYLHGLFGPSCLEPLGDVDRPFRPSELREFSERRYVYIGNHTCAHAVLTNYSLEEAESQIRNAQKFLEEITGKAPSAISYPDGAYSEEVIRICRRIGFKLGFTIEYGKNGLRRLADTQARMELRRVGFTENASILLQCQIFRSDVSLKYAGRNFLRKLMRNRSGRPGC